MKYCLPTIVKCPLIRGVSVAAVCLSVAACSPGTTRFSEDGYMTSSTYGYGGPGGGQAYSTGAIQSADLPAVDGQSAQPMGQSPYDSQTLQSQAMQQQNGAMAPMAPTHNSPAVAPAPAANKAYIVQIGDTLYGIARKTGSSVNTIKAANNLSNGALRVGQSLVIPAAGSAALAQNTQTLRAPQPAPAPANVPAQRAKAVTTAQNNTPTQLIKSRTSQTGTAPASTAPSSVNVPKSTGISAMRWPVQGRLINKFGSRTGTVTNDGIDISVPEGSSVKAAENGVVIYAGDSLKDYGRTVLIKHDNNLVSVYAHNSKILVARGQQVKRGDEVAKSGMSGRASVPMLHFEIRKNSSPVDPMQYLDK